MTEATVKWAGFVNRFEELDSHDCCLAWWDDALILKHGPANYVRVPVCEFRRRIEALEVRVDGGRYDGHAVNHRIEALERNQERLGGRIGALEDRLRQLEGPDPRLQAQGGH